MLHRITSSALVLCLSAATVTAFSPRRLPGPAVAVRDDLTAAKVVENVRRAVRYDKVRKLKYGFTAEEVPAAADNPNGFIYKFGRAGKVRREGTGQNRNPFVFDGKDGWSVDPRIGLAVPNSRSGREKLLFPAWVRSGWWLDKEAPLTMSILAGESDEKTVALSMKFNGGRVGAKLFVNRGTWLPARLVVEYAAGPYTLELSDYKESLGFLYPRRLKTNYRNSDSVFQVKSVVENSSESVDPFVGFRPPDDTTFDNTRPAQLKSAKGEGEGGHYFVRPVVDGKEVGPFHFDSGYFGLTIDARIADELGMPVLSTTRITGNDGNTQTATLRRGKTFQLGRLIIKDPIYLAMDLSGRSAPAGEKRAGVCGYPIFARAVVEFGRGGERIAIYDPATYRLPKGRWQELFYASHGPGV
ncbi:MAG TPA: aspartyl protease family protein, partial [Pyrinomonadaceae bacterium]|nr:aspartyl protease family protein [Pyrinomonadaceae bacterium]